MAEKRKKSKEHGTKSSRVASSSIAATTRSNKGKERARDDSQNDTDTAVLTTCETTSAAPMSHGPSLSGTTPAPDANVKITRQRRKRSVRPSEPSTASNRQTPRRILGPPKRRVASVYDAVAGRMTMSGFQPLMRDLAVGKGTSNPVALPAITPFEVLANHSTGRRLKQQNGEQTDEDDDDDAAAAARQRRQEFREEQRLVYDSYVQGLPVHEQMSSQHSTRTAAASGADASNLQIIPPALELPAGELLEAIHAYVADFYGAQPGAMPLMRQNMDGTALFALGVLLEEIAREQLGTNGDLTFLESSAQDQGPGRRWFNGVREVPFVTEEEIEANRSRKPEYEVVEGSLLKELLS